MDTTCLIRFLRGLCEMKAPSTPPITIPMWHMFFNFSEIGMHPTIRAFLDLMMKENIPKSSHSPTGQPPTPMPHLKAQTPGRNVFPFLLFLALSLLPSPSLSTCAASLMLCFPSQDKYPQVQMATCLSIEMPCVL